MSVPTLQWDAKPAIKIAVDRTNPPSIREIPELGFGDKNTNNILIHSDNMPAMNALLGSYAGRVKCIYADPPYNTGNRFAHYDDRLNHNDWLNFMYPRLVLMRELLAKDGSIWISINDKEGHYLGVVCDEIFGRRNFINTIVWQKKYSSQNDVRWLSNSHDFLLLYAKNKIFWRPNLLPRSSEMNARYKNHDCDPRGAWTAEVLSIPRQNKELNFPIINPAGRAIHPPSGRCWSVSAKRFEELKNDNRIWFGLRGNAAPTMKKFLTEVKCGSVAKTIWLHSEVGHTHDAKTEIKKLFPLEYTPFQTPKPERLIARILHLGSNENDLILDAFLGSGTTAAVAHKMGRRYIGIESEETIRTLCVERLKKVINGEQGGISKSTHWKGGGGFRFYELQTAD
jgi:adenine-specific DNA-methyltransferase